MTHSAAEKRFAGSLARKYAFVLAILVCGAVLTSGVIGLLFASQQSNTAIRRIQREKAVTAATIIAQFITETEDQITWTFRPVSATYAQREDEYLRLLRIAPAITDIRYLDQRGVERVFISRVSLNLINSGVDHSAEPSFVSPTDKRPYVGPVYFRNQSEPYMTVAVREQTADGGVVVAEVNLKFIWDVITRISLRQGGYAYVVDSDGQLVAHRDISRVLRRSDYSGLPQVARIHDAVTTDGSLDESESTMVAADPDGVPVLAAFQPIEPAGWWVFVEEPVNEAFAPVIASVGTTALLLLLGLLVSVAASVVLARRLVKPIRALEHGATEFGAGDLKQRIDIQTGDELEALAVAFNRMADQLSASYADLEQRVEDRTHDLLRALHELEVASKHKSEFLASMSHELRTPMNAVIGFTEMVLGEMVGPVNDKQKEYLDDVLTSARHLLSLINDMLDLAKIEAGRMSLERGLFSLSELVDRSVAIVRPLAARGQVRLSASCAPDVSLVDADERKVKQVLFNLLANAVKFTPAGGSVIVQTRRVDDDIVVSVSDTGIGLAPEDLDRIFEAFQQVTSDDRQGVARTEGTGLGLTLARKFVELHGGTLSVVSELHRGSTFTFRLPVSEAASRAATELSLPPEIVGEGPLVMIVEDDAHALELLRVYLVQAGFSTIASGDPHIISKLVEELHPVAITLDIQLRGSDLDGWDLLARFKRSSASASIPVIVVSIVDEPGKGFALGASEYLVKPIKREDLLGTLQRLGLGPRPRLQPANALMVLSPDAAADTFRAGLTALGFRLRSTCVPREALALARQEQPDLIVTDLLLPEGDGLKLVEQFRNDPATAETPIVVLTPEAMNRDERQLLRGRVAYLARGTNFDADAFIALVQHLLVTPLATSA